MSWETIYSGNQNNSIPFTATHFRVSTNVTNISLLSEVDGKFTQRSKAAIGSSGMDIVNNMDFAKYEYLLNVSASNSSAYGYITDHFVEIPFNRNLSHSGGFMNTTIRRRLKPPPNESPTVTINTISNQTLYENDALQITGTANDPDANQSVTVYYQINSETRRVLATDVSQKSIALSKQLTFKGGRLYDGVTAVTSALTEGVAHKLKVWAVDDQGASSIIVERTFYVVPNRAPNLTVDIPTIEGNINSDKITLSGGYSDPDSNQATVSYKINGSNSVQIASGTSGTWEFEITFGDLKLGKNIIVVEIVDSYGAKTSKTIKLNKSAIETPLLQSTARFKLEPPAGSAKGVLLYIQRDKNLVIDAKISMTLKGEPENFVQMTLENTAPLPNDTTILEDEFYFETTEAKDNIILQIDMTRSSTDVSDKIVLIQGAFD